MILQGICKIKFINTQLKPNNELISSHCIDSLRFLNQVMFQANQVLDKSSIVKDSVSMCY